ncbi:cupin domain-containing protein [Roseateles sp.]|uniref:cupin domain-containing protein n=1 Tax=Roseateles sp. TaxID=1971397 RepID=UPI002E0C3C83|nr:cupin domain-containing protein [Roseateles sp.]
MENFLDQLERHGVQVEHHFGGGVYAKQTLIPAGVVLSQHRHPHDHLSVLAAGRARVITDGAAREYVAPACITIHAGVEHQVIAVTDVVWFCIHATEDTDPATVDRTILTGDGHG